MVSTLIVGYGNISRRDDGVALYIIRRLRERIGLPETDLLEDEQGSAQGKLATICVHQLGPELAETISRYDQVIFIDAHIEGTMRQPLHWQKLVPAYRPSMVSHHLKPEALLALSQALFGRVPEAYVLSVLGHDFDFGEGLSAETMTLAEEAVNRLLADLQSPESARAWSSSGN